MKRTPLKNTNYCKAHGHIRKTITAVMRSAIFSVGRVDTASPTGKHTLKKARSFVRSMQHRHIKTLWVTKQKNYGFLRFPKALKIKGS